MTPNRKQCPICGAFIEQTMAAKCSNCGTEFDLPAERDSDMTEEEARIAELEGVLNRLLDKWWHGGWELFGDDLDEARQVMGWKEPDEDEQEPS